MTTHGKPSQVRNGLIALVLIFCCVTSNLSADEQGLQGDPEAISDAIAMVETMGGVEVWQHVEHLYFVHEWDFVNRYESYMEDEVLDMSSIRSWVKMESVSYSNERAYSPEHGYWRVTDGEFSEGSAESMDNAMARGPYSIYRLARAIARDDSELKIEFGTVEGLPPVPALVFTYGEDEPGGWIVLNARKEPMIWATTQYQYVFGPLARFGNVWVPNWATTSDGLVRYEMVSLKASNQPPDDSLFARPAGHEL